jgi:hypothetical protein
MANGQPMRGGNLSVKAWLFFSRYQGREFLEQCTIPAEFHEADISVDAILGCPWLERQRLGIFPYLDALSIERDDYHLNMLYTDVPPSRTQKRPKKRGKKLKRKVAMVQVALPGDDDYEELNFWDMVNLTCPTAGEFSQEVQLNKEEKKYLRENLQKAEETHVRSVVIAKGDCEKEDPRIEGLRQKIHEEYDGVVLRTEVIPNPPVRGVNGEAMIILKEGAVPQGQKPFRQFGEKHDAMMKIAQQWLEAGFIEKVTDPHVAWLCQAFAVPKNPQLFHGEVWLT